MENCVRKFWDDENESLRNTFYNFIKWAFLVPFLVMGELKLDDKNRYVNDDGSPLFHRMILHKDIDIGQLSLEELEINLRELQFMAMQNSKINSLDFKVWVNPESIWKDGEFVHYDVWITKS